MKKYILCVFLATIICIVPKIGYADNSESQYWKQLYINCTKCWLFYLGYIEKNEKLLLSNSNDLVKKELYDKEIYGAKYGYAVTFVLSGTISNKGLVAKSLNKEVYNEYRSDIETHGKKLDSIYLDFCNGKAKEYTKLSVDLGLAETVLSIINP